jgi:hypothetical protein
MSKPVKLAIVVSAVLLFSPTERATAVSFVWDIKTPKECGDALQVASKRTKQGLIEFVIRMRPEEVANAGDLYRGRVGAQGYLEISSADSKLATMLVHKGSDRDVAESIQPG